MRRGRARTIGGIVALVLASLSLAGAQTLPRDPATLIADRMTLDRGGRRVTAEGNVEVFHEGNHLTASRIVYDRDTDQIAIEGPVTLQDGERMVVLADTAEMTRDLREGILRGARMVLDRQIQIAAGQAERIDGRYVRLKNTVASSCRICNDSDVPIWQVRAEEVLHDRVGQRIHFRNARLEAFGVPIAYTPYLSIPDPSVRRATGFLPPQLVTSGDVGVGVKLPFFVTLGDHADATLTPMFATDARALFGEFRQRFANGDLDFEGAIAEDDISSQEVRGFAFLEGRFRLPRDLRLDFDLEAVSDEAVLLEYDITEKDRLDSELRLSRTVRDQHAEGELILFHTLRDAEDNSTQPTRVAALRYDQRFAPALIGGQAEFSVEGFGSMRTSGRDGVEGRDLVSGTATGGWQRSWIVPGGVVFTTLAGAQFDVQRIFQDDSFDDTETRTTPYSGAELRWPLQRQDRHAAHVLEPVAQLVWSPDDGDTLANEDSLAVEFDETNLFALSRFSGLDGVERGLRANLGVGYTRFDTTGWTLGLSAGRVIREEALGQFASATGLAGNTSDWISSVRLSMAPGLTLIGRSVFDDSGGLSKGEMRLRYNGTRADLSSTFVWLQDDVTESRPDDLSELALRGGYWVTPNWRTAASWRFDPVEEETTRAGLGVTYRTECIDVDLSVSRRFTSSREVSESTSVNFTVALAGFGGRTDPDAARLHRCNG